MKLKRLFAITLESNTPAAAVAAVVDPVIADPATVSIENIEGELATGQNAETGAVDDVLHDVADPATVPADPPVDDDVADAVTGEPPVDAPVSSDEPDDLPDSDEIDDQADEAEAVGNTAELVEAMGDARDSKDTCDQVNEIAVGLEQLYDTLEHINTKRGGASRENLMFANLTLEAYTTRLGLSVPQLVPSLEAFGDDPNARVQLSLEGVADLIATVKQGGDALAEQSMEGVVRLANALKESLPAATARVKAVRARAAAFKGEAPDRMVKADDFAHLLAVDNVFPDDVPGYMAKYGKFGEAMVGPFKDAANQAVDDAADFGNEVDFGSADGFMDSVKNAHGKVKDPRDKLPKDEGSFHLPGSGKLFEDESAQYQGDEPTLSSMSDFCATSAPVDPEDMDIGSFDKLDAVQPLTADDIKTSADCLLGILEKADAAEIAEKGKDSWASIAKTIVQFSDKYNAADEGVQRDIADAADVVVGYLDTVQTMSEWSILSFLTNLVHTANAFVLYAERSLASGGGETDDTISQEELDAAIARDEAEEAVSQEGVVGAIGGAVAGAALAAKVSMGNPIVTVGGALAGGIAGHKLTKAKPAVTTPPAATASKEGMSAAALAAVDAAKPAPKPADTEKQVRMDARMAKVRAGEKLSKEEMEEEAADNASMEGVNGAATGAAVGGIAGAYMAGPVGSLAGAIVGAGYGHLVEHRMKEEDRQKRRKARLAKHKAGTRLSKEELDQAVTDDAETASFESLMLQVTALETSLAEPPVSISTEAVEGKSDQVTGEPGVKVEGATDDVTGEPGVKHEGKVDDGVPDGSVNKTAEGTPAAAPAKPADPAPSEIPAAEGPARTAAGDIIPSDAQTGAADGTPADAIAMEAMKILLKSGDKVKYSKGYGKIVKVFTSPTKYKGEVHHCSKDNPKFEVKNDLGHLSLHKASALQKI
jgi:outer membrane lipoprotein SlyB